ncbi:MAG TPA: putative glycoside hydrolase [Acidimicrobiales bacterium]|nr:putative glycoside hydrolase [Acidimicrobiales bacterium]
MAATPIRRRLAALLVLLTAFALLGTHIFDASGTTAAASVWGTFAHVATGDLATADAKQAVTQSYDMLALRGNLTSALLADLHGRRPGIVLLAYEKAAGLNNSEVTSISATNPEWIARDRFGQVIHPQSIQDTTLGDLTNPAFRAWQASKFAGEVALGADGAFVDTLGAYFPPDYYTGRPAIGGVEITDAAWRDGSADLVSRIKAATGRPVVANGFGLGSGAAYFKTPADADVVINAADGVQIEGFTRLGSAPPDQYLTAAKWDQDLAFLDLLGARNKLALAYTKVKAGATAAQLAALRDYGLGSFLLAFAPGRSYFGFDDGNAIPAVASDASWARGLGAPTAPRERSGTDGWARQFQTGRLTVRVATPPTVAGGDGRVAATYTGTGSGRSTYPITVATGRVTATLTFADGGYRTLMVTNPQGYVAAGPVSTGSPIVIDTTLTAGTYSFAVQGGSNIGPFTLRVEYLPPGGGPPPATTTTSSSTSTTVAGTTTTSSTTTTTRATTTTTSSTTTTSTTAPGGRRSVSFTGTGSGRTTYPIAVGAGRVTATLTFANGGYRTLMVTNQAGYVVAGPVSTGSPIVIDTTLTAGTYSFAVQGGSNVGPYTLRVDYPAP